MTDLQKKRRKEKRKSAIEAELLKFMEKGMKDALNAAMEEIIKDWK